MQFAESRILIFAKAPEPGKVKTRLAGELGDDGAATLYRRLLERTLEFTTQADLCAVEIWCGPDVNHPYFGELATRWPVALYSQCQGDLGARMLHAASAALHRASGVLLIGGDCPAMTPAYLADALASLQRGADAVLGPAEDGGYVLLGLRRSDASLFDAVPWSTDQVSAITRSRLDRLGWRWEELPVLWDVDRPEDLVRLRTLSGFGQSM